MRLAALATALLLSLAGTATGQSPSPLERRISLHVRDASLRDALDRVAATAGIRLSYSAENLPLDRRVSIARDSASLDDVLTHLLENLPVQPVAVGSDQVVLAPRASPPPDSVQRPATVLDRVVVSGSTIGASERPLP